MHNLTLKITEPGKQFTKTPAISNRFTEAQKRKLAKASMDFESLLTSLMLKSMTKSAGGLFGKNNYGGDTFDLLFENKLAEFMTKSDGMGIAKVIYKKLTGESMPKMPSVIKAPNSNSVLKYNSNINNNLSISPSKAALKRLKKYENIIKQAALKHGMDENLLKSVILTESAGNPYALSKANAKGLMQLMDSTATTMGVRNIWDPKENIFGGAKYLSQMIQQYDGNLKLALAAYNAGPAAVNKYGGVPPFEETKNYIARVIGYKNNLEE